MLTKSLVQTQSPSFLLSSSSTCLFSCTVGRNSSLPIVQTRKGSRRSRIRCSSDAEAAQKAIQQSALSATLGPTTVKAVVMVKATVGGMFAHTGIDRGLDDLGDLLGRTLLLELISAELDEETGREKKAVEAFAHRGESKGEEVKYEATFAIPKGFGEIGGVLVTNEHHKEMYLNDIVLTTGDETTAFNIDCRSWVHSKFDDPQKRIFFTTKTKTSRPTVIEVAVGIAILVCARKAVLSYPLRKIADSTHGMWDNDFFKTKTSRPTVTEVAVGVTILVCARKAVLSYPLRKVAYPTHNVWGNDFFKCYLPSETPGGLLELRKKELETMCGNGKGERKKFERIYDYDTYNDLGDPNDEEKARPVLGGTKDLPYPRRCRTGRPKTEKDPLSEERSRSIYVPRDESFSEVKQVNFSIKTLRSVLHALVPSIETAIVDTKRGFEHFKAIDMLFNEGVALPKQKGISSLKTTIPRLVKAIELGKDLLLFETPAMINKDGFSWFRDEEFSRQTLAGLNPLSIQLVTEFPFVSKLDPKIYGPPESAITEEIVNQEIRGIMTVKEALEQKKLFVLDYHDLLLPCVLKVRELEDTTLYGSRTLFFLTPNGTLKPIAIELTRPQSPTKPQWKRVFTHCWDATGAWLWKLAKAHVCAHDGGYHELVSHWLRTHCCTEPYVIALNRQLSSMHPIYRLMHPHFRYTMEINAIARELLINAGGVIEACFSPGKYSIELSSVAYREQWRFDMEALPADLIRRGMAVEDTTAEYGLKLTIEDYPYANDGLLIWSSIKEWVSDYVNHYYSSPSKIQEDYELQNWWTEVRTKGHADKKDEPWWPSLYTQDDLIQILTTIIWVASGHHAAVNFGQYHYAGYFPNRPTIARVNMPVEGGENTEEFARFWNKPEAALLQCFPSQIQATVVMAILDTLSTHSSDEEYMSANAEPSWSKDPVIYAAFERFNGRMKGIEGIIDDRNVNPELMNRCGSGIVPYELLKPFSEPGVTGKGVPNSISI